MAKNWDTETAKTCRLPEFKADACETCRDKRYCEVHKRGMVQMSIWDILDEKKSDFPCDTCKHDVKGCCDYDELLGRHCVLGSAYESNEWERLTCFDYIEWESDFNMPLIKAISESNIMTHPDVICEGTVNGTPAYIGFKAWVSGPGECYLEYEAVQYKVKEN